VLLLVLVLALNLAVVLAGQPRRHQEQGREQEQGTTTASVLGAVNL
jgi:hypothetical protein